MHFYLIPERAAWRQPAQMVASAPGALWPRTKWARSRCLAFGLLLLAVGCGGGGGRPHVAMAEVSGKVLYNRQPLPGGTVGFYATQVEFMNPAIIDENGNYKIEAPVGEVKITVDNRFLNPAATKFPEAKKGAGRPPGAAETPQVKGTYKRIPTKYYSRDTTDLTYTVTKGAQTYDIELKD
jgi:hypothetical protein